MIMMRPSLMARMGRALPFFAIMAIGPQSHSDAFMCTGNLSKYVPRSYAVCACSCQGSFSICSALRPPTVLDPQPSRPRSKLACKILPCKLQTYQVRPLKNSRSKAALIKCQLFPILLFSRARSTGHGLWTISRRHFLSAPSCEASGLVKEARSQVR